MSTVKVHVEYQDNLSPPLQKRNPTMPPKPRGHPPKKSCNLAGLQNNHSLTSIPSMTSFSQGCQTVSEEDEELIMRY